MAICRKCFLSVVCVLGFSLPCHAVSARAQSNAPKTAAAVVVPPATATTASPALGVSLVERVIELESKEKNPLNARREIVERALQKISEDLVRESIGEAKYLRNRSVVAKIIKNPGRYIPYSKNGELVPIGKDEGFRMKVTMRASLSDLQSLLLENGLFYQTDGTPAVLPFVSFWDKVNSRSYDWWRGSDQAFLINQMKGFEEALKAQFTRSNFYVIRPVNLRYANMLPSGFRSDSLRFEDRAAIAREFGAAVVLEGDITVGKSNERRDAFALQIKLQAIQVANKRVIGEITRIFETDAGSFEWAVAKKLKEASENATQDLAAQVLEAWQKGSIGASIYKLTLRGRLPLVQQEAFKEIVKNKVLEVKNIRERLISSDEMTFELDSSLTTQELGTRLKSLEVGNQRLTLESVSDSELTYKVTKL